ncbi:MAG: hypothetical protein NTV39_04600 [Candidatus Saccharibacteria bacterium]|nr:hypothetical protein [Candidatus Saccharibacteria bacterium]
MASHWQLADLDPPTFVLVVDVKSDDMIIDELSKLAYIVKFGDRFVEEDPDYPGFSFAVIGTVKLMVDKTSTGESLFAAYQLGCQDSPETCVVL